MMSLIYQLDHWLFTVINSQVGRWPWLDSLARLLLNDYFVPTLFGVMLLALWFEGTTAHGRLTNQRAVLLGALGAALANLLLKIINLLYFRPRPFATQEVNLLFYRPTDSSLPSNAAVIGFSIAVGVWLYQRRWGWLFLLIAFLFGLSRIFGGVHYPLDLISGAILGAIAAGLLHRQEDFLNKLLTIIIKLNAKLLGL
jgi:undecaprenyl-diphosphatase